jgi:hypothetical protein
LQLAKVEFNLSANLGFPAVFGEAENDDFFSGDRTISTVIPLDFVAFSASWFSFHFSLPLD